MLHVSQRAQASSLEGGGNGMPQLGPSAGGNEPWKGGSRTNSAALAWLVEEERAVPPPVPIVATGVAAQLAFRFWLQDKGAMTLGRRP